MREPPAGAWLCDALCFPRAVAVRERWQREQQVGAPYGSATPQDAQAVPALSASRLRWWALIVFSTMSAVQNAIWISFSVVVDPARTFFGVGTGAPPPRTPPSLSLARALSPPLL